MADENRREICRKRKAGRPPTGWPAVFVLSALPAFPAAAQTPETSGAFWPALDVHVPFAPSLKLFAFGELKTDEDFPYRQANVGASLGYQWSRMTKPHRVNNDSDKENFLVTAAGYEHFETIQSGSDKFENRILLDATPRFRPAAPERLRPGRERLPRRGAVTSGGASAV